MRTFTPGKLYFLIKFQDKELTVPVVRTLRFVERKNPHKGEDMLVFDELTDDGDAEKLALRESDADHLAIDSDELMRRLGRCFQGTLSKVD